MSSKHTRRFRVEEVSKTVYRTTIRLDKDEGQSVQCSDVVCLHGKDVFVRLPTDGQEKPTF